MPWEFVLGAFLRLFDPFPLQEGLSLACLPAVALCEGWG